MGLQLERLAAVVEMFKVRMQGQYGAKDDKRLRDVAKEMWRDWGFRQGVMRGYWVSRVIVLRIVLDLRSDHRRTGDPCVCWVGLIALST